MMSNSSSSSNQDNCSDTKGAVNTDDNNNTSTDIDNDNEIDSGDRNTDESGGGTTNESESDNGNGNVVELSEMEMKELGTEEEQEQQQHKGDEIYTSRTTNNMNMIGESNANAIGNGSDNNNNTDSADDGGNYNDRNNNNIDNDTTSTRNQYEYEYEYEYDQDEREDDKNSTKKSSLFQSLLPSSLLPPQTQQNQMMLDCDHYNYGHYNYNYNPHEQKEQHGHDHHGHGHDQNQNRIQNQPNQNNNEDHQEQHEKEYIAHKWNAFLHKYHIYILLTAIIILIPIGLYSFPKFLASTDSTIHPIPNSLSEQAVNRFREAFSESADVSASVSARSARSGRRRRRKSGVATAAAMPIMGVNGSVGGSVGGSDGRSTSATGKGLRSDDPLNPGIIILLEHHVNGTRKATRKSTSTSTSSFSIANTDTFVDGTSDLYRVTKNYTFELEKYLIHNLPVPPSCAVSPSINSDTDSFVNSNLSDKLDLSTTNTSNTSRRTTSTPSIVSAAAIITPVVNVVSYYSLQEEKLSTASKSLVAKDGNIILLYVSYSIPSCLYGGSTSTSTTRSILGITTKKQQKTIQHNIQRKYAASILSLIQSYTQKHLLIAEAPQEQHKEQEKIQLGGRQQEQSSFNITFGYTGIIPFQDDMSKSIKQDVHRLHHYILPLSLLLLCVALRGHVTIIVVPIFSVLCVVCSWSTIMCILIYYGYIQVTQFTPNVMMSLSIGLGIDYTLFLLSRVLTEISFLRRQMLFNRRRSTVRDYYDGYDRRWEDDDRDTNGGIGDNMDDSYKGGLLLLEGEEDIEEREGSDKSRLEQKEQREKQEKQEEKDIQYKAISTMIRHAGHTILISGITLMCTFLGLLLFPIHALQSVSIGASICILSCLLCNLTLVPSLLHSELGFLILCTSRPKGGGTGMDTMISTLYSWFSFCRKKHRERKYKSRVESRARLSSAGSTRSSNRVNSLFSVTNNDNTGDSNGEGQPDETYTCFEDLLLQREFSNESTMTTKHTNVTKLKEEEDLQDSFMSDAARIPGQGWSNDSSEIVLNAIDVDTSSFWNKLSNHLLHPTRSIIILASITLLLLPIAFQFRHMKTSVSFELMMPSNSPSMQTYQLLGDLFGKGKVSPYRLLFDGMNYGDRVDTAEAFDVMHNFIKHLEAESDDSKGGITVNCTGIAWSKNTAISHTTYAAAKACSATFNTCPIESFRELVKLDSASTSNDGLSTLITCILSESSFSDNAVDWLVRSRQQIESLGRSGQLQNFTVNVDGGASIEYDASHAVSTSLGMMGTITFLCVFLLIWIAFQSIVTPIRSVFSICMTLFSVYGLVVIVYQQNEGSVSWLTVPMSFSIIVGLGLDYDVFLINRVLEYRICGYDHESSIVAGLYQTGSIITAAGVIMAVSFGGLIFSESPAVYQWAFSLTMAVLLDTFVMRTCVVPILLAKTGKYSWYPRALPPEIVSLEPERNDDDDHVLL